MPRTERANLSSLVCLSAEMMGYRRSGALRGGSCGGRATDGGPGFPQDRPVSLPDRAAGASGFRERQWRLIRGGRGRVDLAVEVDGDEQMLVIIEIKGTDWDAIPADRVMRNLRRHLCQLQAYLDTAIEDMEAGRWEGIVGALLYPSRPARAETLAMIEAVAGEQAVQVTWYDDVDWQL
jgi:hypothetical protein